MGHFASLARFTPIFIEGFGTARDIPTFLSLLLTTTITMTTTTRRTSTNTGNKEVSKSVIMSTNNQSYSYSPKALLASWERLRQKEEELLERASGDAPMEVGAASGKIVVAATQITGTGLPASDVAGFCFRAEQAIEQAVAAGANLVLLPELWSGPYFCQSVTAELMLLATPIEQSVLIKRMQLLAKLYSVVLPVSVYEAKNNALYNTVVMIDADGSVLGIYRKSHIPESTGYQEKFYFTPGDSGFQVWETKIGRIGVGICWDQWFPECARAMALQGADVLLYPTAIGSEPADPGIDSADHWQRVMQGHAAANMVPVAAANRFGTEILLREDADDSTEQQRIHFYGRSFITDNTGAIVAVCADNTAEQPVRIITAEIDAEKNRRDRAAWGLFRDRRPDLYKSLLTKDGGGIQSSQGS
jgi:N-carbamoylputrescine amidase